MNADNKDDARIGPYTGHVRAEYCAPDLLAALADMPALLRGEGSLVVSASRNRNVRVAIPRAGRRLNLMVKAFGAEGPLKDLIDLKWRGSKARRTWRTAIVLQTHGVGTPPPIGFLERREGGRLLESYFLAEYVEDVTSFKDELIRLYRHEPLCERLMTLLQTVAEAISRMHEAGVRHNDLGNQNILLRRAGDGAWGDVQFTDLNRARVRRLLSLRERARDLSRISLPSDFLRVFIEMYFGGEIPSRAFLRWERRYRRLYAVHSGSRRLRHPIRERRIRERAETYPDPRDIWVWDERSGQAVSALRSRDRQRYRSKRDFVAMAAATARAALPVWSVYRALRRQCFAAPVQMKGRIRVAINPWAETVERELTLLRGLGPVPTLVRFCHHEPRERWEFLIGVVRELRQRGHDVSAALVQDRRAVREPGQWRDFAAYVTGHIGGDVQWIEVGHAINRVKWGVWSLAEHRRLLNAVAEVAAQYPRVRFTGPAVIDFEYPHLVSALRNVPPELRFHALSHHLYVDRRGAPERRQDGFAALEKFILARAVAHTTKACDDRLIVSEVNWPLKGTGVYSPVGSPYESPGPRFNDPSVSEDDYADYMIRYLLIALCSGMVEQVCWWRLIARGYGLVDDTNAANWRERPAYGMLRTFLGRVGGGRFVERRVADGGEFFVFDLPREGRLCLAYAPEGTPTVRVPFEFAGLEDAFGRSLPRGSGAVTLTGRPVYLLLR